MMGRILGVDCDHCSNLELVSLQFPGSPDVQQGVWLIGTFVAEVWEKIFIRGAPRLKKEQFFGFLKFKYKMTEELGIHIGVFPALV